MFQNLRKNSSVYVLSRADGISFSIGTVTDIAKALPNGMPQPIMPYSKADDYLTLTVSVNGREYVFTNIPYSAEAMDFPTQGFFIADNRNAMNAEVKNIESQSIDAISEKTINYHKGVIESCRRIYPEINPEYAESRQQNERLDSLERMIKEIYEKMGSETGA